MLSALRADRDLLKGRFLVPPAPVSHIMHDGRYEEYELVCCDAVQSRWGGGV
jgi:hypothetical protein